MGWLSGWQYRKSHVINSASGAGINYQIRIKTHYGSGTDSGENVYLNGKCRTDFGDVRFCDNDGTTLLDYWMESKVDSDYAIFWVEVADDLSTNPATIYIYYGKSDATTTSNGENTFIFFDDFNGDLSKWTQISGTWTIVTDTTYGVNVLQDTGRDNDRIRANNVTITNNRIRFKARATGTTSIGLQCRARADINLSNSYVQLDEWISGNSYGITGGTSVSFTFGTLYHISDFLLYGSDASASVDGTGPATGTTTLTNGYFGLRRGISGANRFFVDWIFVAKYVSPEPAHGSWGSEETPSGQIYEIYVDAVSQLVAMPAYETTFNISKDASITSQSLTASETIFRIEKEIVVGAFAEVVVEKVVGQIFEIFKDAITQASVSLQAFGVYPVDVEALVKASAMPSLQQTLGISKDAVAAAVSTLLTQSAFSISPEATIKVLAEFSIIKQTEVKITRLFLVMGDLAIQIQGS